MAIILSSSARATRQWPSHAPGGSQFWIPAMSSLRLLLPAATALLLSLTAQLSALDVEAALRHAADSAEATVVELDGAYTTYPRKTLERGAVPKINGVRITIPPSGKWFTKGSGDWTAGFWPGLLWYLHGSGTSGSSPDFFSMEAQNWTADMLRQATQNTHDLGFMVYNSAGHGLRLLGDAHPLATEYRSALLTAADTIATKRYDPLIDGGWGGIRAFAGHSRDQVIIDTMMNLELLYWSAANGGPAEHAQIATAHADLTSRFHVRPDGSTYQVASFYRGDASDGSYEAGDFKAFATRQGQSPDSTWARGQAWAIHGFSTVYRETAADQFMLTGRALIAYYLDALGRNGSVDGVPWNDLDADPTLKWAVKDTSAAAVATSGMLAWANLDADPLEREIAFRGAMRGLTAMAGPYSSANSRNDPAYPSSGIVVKSVGVHAGGGEDTVSMIYSDYYYVEALLRYRELVQNRRFRSIEIAVSGQDVPTLVELKTSGASDLADGVASFDHVEGDADSVIGFVSGNSN